MALTFVARGCSGGVEREFVGSGVRAELVAVETANPHLFIHYRNANTTSPVTPWWIGRRLGMSAQSIRQDRILEEAHASGGDVRLICDLFGLSIAGAYRYTVTVDHSGITDYANASTHS